MVKSQPYLKAIAWTILSAGLAWGVSMILPSTTHNGYSIIILTLIVVIVIWALIFRKKMNTRGGKMIFYFGIALSVIGFALISSQLDFHNEQNKSEIQIQTDTLITDITAYSKTVPPMPMPTYSDDPAERDRLWSEYTQNITDYYSKINSDFFNKFNTRIANTMIKLHDFHIITDDEFESDKYLYNFMPTAYNTYASALLERLNIYKARLDILEETLREK